ncbi:MAG: hypothetical protein AABW79_03665 [Nanoarchaeota archaeon]
MKRAQSAIEFMILIGVLLLLMTGFLAFVGNNISQKQIEQRTALMRSIADNIEQEIRLANSASNGYSRNLELPSTILGKEYAIDIIDSLLQIRTLDAKSSLAVPISNVTGTLTPGANIIRKVNNQVYANQ